MKRIMTFLLTAALIFGSVMPHTIVYANENDEEVYESSGEESMVSGEDSSESTVSSEENDSYSENATGNEPDENIGTTSRQSIALSEASRSGNNLEQFGLTVENGTLMITQAQELILLSNCAPKEYQNLTLFMNITGTLDLTGTAEYDGVDYYFQGFGSETYPFAGEFSGSGVTLTIDRTLFNGLTSGANLNSQMVEWKGTISQPMLAKVYSFVDGGEHDFPIKVSVAATEQNENYIAGNLIDKIIKGPAYEGNAGVLKIGKDAVDYNTSNNKNAIEITNNENAGLICNTLEAGAIKLNDFAYPSTFKVTAETGSAGGFIGKMERGTALEVTNTMTVATSTTITGGSNAGGIVGESVGASVTLKQSSIASTVSATNGNAGGIIGLATDTTIVSSEISVKSLAASGVNAGGLFGSYQQSESNPFTPAAV